MAVASPLSAVAMPMTLNGVFLMVSVASTASLFWLAYALSTTATAVSVSPAWKVRPEVILEVVSGPSAGCATSAP